MSSKLWQQPFVNVFKHFQVSEWKKCSKEGDVSTIMDKTLKCSVYRISGSVPAGNYIQFPKTASQSLGLTGHYIYMLFKPIVTKYFVVHIDAATDDGVIIRISFSNLFKEFKSTSTWLQFPFVSNPVPGSVEAVTSAALPLESKVGTAPKSSRWTLLCIDLHYMLSVYLNRKYAYVKTIRLCANMLVKNVFTSDTKYTPGISMKVARKTGLLGTGFIPLPREMSFSAEDLTDWQRRYDYVTFPAENGDKTSCDVIPGQAKSPRQSKRLGTLSPVKFSETEYPIGVGKERTYSPKQYTRNPVKSRVAMVDKLLESQSSKTKVYAGQLPEVGLNQHDDGNIDNESIHIYAGQKDRITSHRGIHIDAAKQTTSVEDLYQQPKSMELNVKSSINCLQPDPILALDRLIGVGGGTMKSLLWTKPPSHIVYPCHAVIVSMDAKTGKQSFLLGHNSKITALDFNGNSSMLASAELGDDAVIRIWKYKSRKCLAVFQSHMNDPYCLSFSLSGSKLCALGHDNHGKQAVAVWDAGFIMNGHRVTMIAKAHLDVHISKIKICPFDDLKLVSCGKSNIRIWKLKGGSLRSRPIDLGEHHSSDFTDFDFECVQRLVQDTSDRHLYSCTASGTVLVINFRNLSIVKVYRLLADQSSFTCLAVNDAFCATGSNDGYLRLWPLDFDGPFMEAEHEGVISTVAISSDGILVSAIANTGNLGVLDLSTKSYKTLVRSHLRRIISLSFDDIRSQIASVSEDRGIKIWNQGDMTQLYDFRAPEDTPSVASFHPIKEILVCGFDNGVVRVFDIASASLIAEQESQKGKITGLLMTPDGSYLHVSDSKGSLALYEGSQSYRLIRLLPNALAKLEHITHNPIALDDNGRRLACIGPSPFVVTVFDARSLDELLRIDITSMIQNKNDRKIDAGHLLCYTPLSIGHLVVVTSTSKMLKLEAKSGQLISEVSNIHRGHVTAICVSSTGQHLATAGDKVIKIWDYHMRMDLNFQVFIGHSDPITCLKFTADCCQLYSAGECLFIWNFRGNWKRKDPKSLTHKSQKHMIDFPKQSKTGQGLFSDLEQNPMKAEDDITSPRGTVPLPLEYEPIDLKMSPIAQEAPKQKIDGRLDISSESSTDDDLGAIPIENYPGSHTKGRVVISDVEPMPTVTADSIVQHHAPPMVMAHFKMREKVSKLAEKRYSAPSHQAGLRLKSVIGYDGRGRNNIIWHPITGLFAYVCGCIVVIEDLTSGKQKLLRYHMEDISSLAAQNDGEVIASASVAGPSSSKSQICIWEIKTGLCRKVISHHKYVAIALQYSRDDRFLATVGDFRECSVAIWSTIDYSLLVTSFTRYPIHCVKWDPYTMNEFATVGQNGAVLFWLLDETKHQVTLNVHEAEVPEDIFTDTHETTFDMTSLVYAGNSVMYVGASNGVVSAWDTRENKCFMHWKSDNAEILQMIVCDGKLITGGASQNLCLWSVTGVANLRNTEDQQTVLHGRNGLIMDDEMQLDGCIISAIFDKNLDIGVVGTTSGTIWYINWDERTSIRLISGHKEQVNALTFGGNDGCFMASCASDGSVRLWNTDTYEQTLQFLVLNQHCNCISFRPLPQSPSLHTFTQDGRHETTIHSSSTKTDRPSQCVAGYSDGTVRMFDLGLVEMILKLRPHPVSVTAIAFSSDGRVIISGAEDGLIAISSPTTGMTVRMLTDHKTAPITDIHVSSHKDHSYSLSSPTLWLAASADRRVSVWTADWSKDFCELVDWLSFPAPNFAPDGTIVNKSEKDYYRHFPPSLARFSPVDSDIIIYTGYGMKKQLSYYSLSRKKVVKAFSLTEWPQTIDISPAGNLIAIGSKDRLVKIVDYNEGTFQDFVAHSDAVRVVKFSPHANMLFSAGYTDVVVWTLSSI